MTTKDTLGNPTSGANGRSLASFELALRQFQCSIQDPVAAVDEALAESPGLVMGHALRAYLHLLGTEPGVLPVAKESHEKASALRSNDRERGHLAAIGHLIEGRWAAAGRALEDVAIDHPTDVLALQVGHLIDFFRADSRMLRDRIARAMPAWSNTMPGYHAVLGMHAFGLEETGDYVRAEASGREGVELEPRDGWAQHAVAHVMEMQGRQKDGIAWMRANQDGWTRDSFFCGHNWWHLALYHLDLGETDQALALFDGPIHGKRSTVVMDMLDASALLWRLHLLGVDLGNRWNTVADGWEPMAGAGNYAFNDAHAMMAFVGAGRPKAAKQVLAAQRRAMKGAGDNAAFTREVGHPLCLAIGAFGRGAYGEVTTLLRPIRNIASRFGGSHAQRDLIDQTIIAAALRGSERSLARALAAERLAVKPNSLANRRLVEQARAA
ncbi:MAG: tetratricopeptide repeat protein [Alphaproteobacteria bacterium]|nr:tetratricopeptide repeat protein [Alphaproteobacteria bacterium]